MIFLSLKAKLSKVSTTRLVCHFPIGFPCQDCCKPGVTKSWIEFRDKSFYPVSLHNRTSCAMCKQRTKPWKWSIPAGTHK